MSRYKCERCEARFYIEDAAVIPDDINPNEGTVVCPECGDDEIYELTYCSVCGEESETHICAECRKYLVDRLKNSMSVFSDIEIEALNDIYDGRNFP